MNKERPGTLHEAIERVILSAKQGLPYGVADHFYLFVNDGEIELCIRSTIEKIDQTVAVSLHDVGNPDYNAVQQIRIDGNGDVIDTYNSLLCPAWIKPSKLDDPASWVSFIEKHDFAGHAALAYRLEVRNERKEATK